VVNPIDRRPDDGIMTVLAGVSSRDVLRGLANGTHPRVGGMAATAGLGGALEYTTQMAAFAGHVSVRAGEGKFRGVVIEVDVRLGGRNAERYQKENDIQYKPEFDLSG